MNEITIGMPRMHVEFGERRDFLPAFVARLIRRAAITCYSWPGVHPEACMTHYAQQLEPFIEVLFEKGYDGLSLDGMYFERALYRAALKAWINDDKADPKTTRETD